MSAGHHFPLHAVSAQVPLVGHNSPLHAVSAQAPLAGHDFPLHAVSAQTPLVGHNSPLHAVSAQAPLVGYDPLHTSQTLVTLTLHAVSAQAPLVEVVEEGQGDDDEADVLVVNEALTGRHRASEAAGQGALVRNILEAEKALQVCVTVTQ